MKIRKMAVSAMIRCFGIKKLWLRLFVTIRILFLLPSFFFYYYWRKNVWMNSVCSTLGDISALCRRASVSLAFSFFLHKPLKIFICIVNYTWNGLIYSEWCFTFYFCIFFVTTIMAFGNMKKTRRTHAHRKTTAHYD